MKPSHIRILAALPVLILSVANMPPFVHLWSDSVSNWIDVGSWTALLVYLAVTAPFNRWMLREEWDFFTTFTGAWGFALGMVIPVNFLLLAGAAQARKALGLHGATGIVVGLVAAVLVAAAATLGVLFLLDWAYHRINAAYAAAEQRKARNGGAA